MNLTNNGKKMKTAIALFLVLSVIIPIAGLQTTGAHNPPVTVRVWCYAAVAPNVIGVGQQTLITFWCNMIPPTAQVDSRLWRQMAFLFGHHLAQRNQRNNGTVSF